MIHFLCVGSEQYVFSRCSEDPQKVVTSGHPANNSDSIIKIIATIY